jgi:hypothetical protein
MLTLAREGIVLGLQQAGYGYIEWNVPAALEYQPGQAIPIVLRVTNPSPEAREYQLYLGLFDPETGELIPDTLGLIRVDEKDSFTVAGGSYVEMEGEVTVDRTNVILAILLYDVASDTTPSYVATQLSAPAPGWDLTPLLAGVFAIAMVGMVAPMVTRLFKE